MKIVLCHNYYRLPGGEDRVFEDERDLLTEHGHDVRTITKHNCDVASASKTVQEALWNSNAFDELSQLAAEFKPDIVHFTNTFPIFSPSAYWAFHEHGIPVIQSLHNYRTICPGSLLMRNDQLCTKCVGKSFQWPAIVHGCYRSSRVSSAVAAASNAVHNLLGTWDLKVARYIALSEFSREQFVRGGLPANKVVVKPNFVLQTSNYVDSSGSNVCVFVGRLSHEKGVQVLLKAWEQLANPGRLKIFGSGPLESLVQKHVEQNSTIEYLGQVRHDRIMSELAHAKVAVVPSLSVETFGRVIIEANSVGTPVIATNQGAIAENVKDGHTGWLVPPNNVTLLSQHLKEVLTNQGEVRVRGLRAHSFFEQNFSANANYLTLMEIYREAIHSQEKKKQPAFAPQGRIETYATRQEHALGSDEPNTAPCPTVIELAPPPEPTLSVVPAADEIPEENSPALDSEGDIESETPWHATFARESVSPFDGNHGDVASDSPDEHAANEPISWPPKVDLFGLRVSKTNYEEAVEAIRLAATHQEPASVTCHAAHAIVEFTNSQSRSDMLNQFEMILPDGQPVRWAMNWIHGARLKDRVYGPELMWRTCRMASEQGIPVGLYGGSIKTLDLLESSLLDEFPNLQIVCSISPPFRKLELDENEEYVRRINNSGARILFIGLGCPKQDFFAFQNRELLDTVQICVGAAFDFHAGTKPTAPHWMQASGLEWLFRLACEPRRLLLRYSVTNTVFLLRLTRQLLFGPRTPLP